MCTTPAIPRFRLAGASSRRKRARLKRVNIHWPIPTKIGHFDFYSIVVILVLVLVQNSWIITVEKYREAGILYPRYKEDMLVYIQHHKNLWDKVDRTENQCILAGKYSDLQWQNTVIFTTTVIFSTVKNSANLIELRKSFHCLHNHI